jgi:hypothetical protein
MPVPGAPATTASSRRRQVLLATGATATIPALGKDDRPAIERLFAAVRPDDLYTRFSTARTTTMQAALLSELKLGDPRRREDAAGPLVPAAVVGGPCRDLASVAIVGPVH